MNRGEVRSVAEIGMIADLDMNGIDNARNALLKVAKHGGLDWLLMVDSDTWCEPGSSLVTMILEADQAGASAVGAPVQIRGWQSPLNVYRFRKDTEETVRVETIPPKEFGERPFECDAIGGAVLAINLNTIGDSQFLFREHQGIKVSEDIEFCRQLREKKLIIHCDPRVATMHVNKPDVLVYNPRQQSLLGM